MTGVLRRETTVITRILKPIYGRIIDRDKMARNMPLRFCILIVYGRLRVVSFDLGLFSSDWPKEETEKR